MSAHFLDDKMTLIFYYLTNSNALSFALIAAKKLIDNFHKDADEGNAD